MILNSTTHLINDILVKQVQDPYISHPDNPNIKIPKYLTLQIKMTDGYGLIFETQSHQNKWDAYRFHEQFALYSNRVQRLLENKSSDTYQELIDIWKEYQSWYGQLPMSFTLFGIKWELRGLTESIWLTGN